MKSRLLFLLLIMLLLFASACNPAEETLAEPVKLADAPQTQEQERVDMAEEKPIAEPASGLPVQPLNPVPTAQINFQTDLVDELVYRLSYMSSPIAGRKVTTVPGQLPNAPRRYRNGIHEGVDYYGISGGTIVLAAADGTVIRADHNFQEMTLAEYEEAIRLSAAAPTTPPELLDKFRGMQVWIRHDDGVVTRYCHLASINPEITAGIRVAGGQALAQVGNTGMRANIVGETKNASDEPHLHFEIWHGNTFLGQGRPLSEVLELYTRILD
ncbi:MAG: peptidoglycan DD-metalloendopeptidase family protein [Dethiobacter sp.]|jgi:murein DD-endopeptidase MepM/ murein hydrolase activator NlpD|nr:peptidoglycan DD-metalloendopeptidase family protein [Dethiobacter sp.]MBS3989883.1 peptidoglycan DD-metalloendopeptidase family protein [Dethiobacter sp.]